MAWSNSRHTRYLTRNGKKTNQSANFSIFGLDPSPFRSTLRPGPSLWCRLAGMLAQGHVASPWEVLVRFSNCTLESVCVGSFHLPDGCTLFFSSGKSASIVAFLNSCVITCYNPNGFYTVIAQRSVYRCPTPTSGESQNVITLSEHALLV